MNYSLFRNKLYFSALRLNYLNCLIATYLDEKCTLNADYQGKLILQMQHSVHLSVYV